MNAFAPFAQGFQTGLGAVQRQQQMAMQQDQMALQQQKFQAEQTALAQAEQTKQQIMGLREAAMGGNQDARNQLAIYDPKGYSELSKVWNAQREENQQGYRLQAAYGIGMLANADTPERLEMSKNLALAGLSELGVNNQAIEQLVSMPPEKLQSFIRNGSANGFLEQLGLGSGDDYYAKPKDDNVSYQMKKVKRESDGKEVFIAFNPKNPEESFELPSYAPPEPEVQQTMEVMAKGFRGSKKQYEGLLDQEFSVRKFDDIANQAVAILESNPEAANWTEGALAKLDGLVQEVKQAFSGFSDQKDSVFNVDEYTNPESESYIPELAGIENAVLRQNMFNLALAYASASGLGEGRALTDKDVQKAMTAVGAEGVMDVKDRVARIKNAKNQLRKNFIMKYNTHHDDANKIKDDYFGPMEDIGITGATPASASGQDNPYPTPVTQGEYDKIPRGAWYTNSAGQVVQKKG